jgi:hypothetical protein
MKTSTGLVYTFTHYSISQHTFHSVLSFLSQLTAHRALVVCNFSTYLTSLPSATYFHSEHCFLHDSFAYSSYCNFPVPPPPTPLLTFLFFRLCSNLVSLYAQGPILVAFSKIDRVGMFKHRLVWGT